MVYSTCSYSYEEDEAVIKHLLDGTNATLFGNGPEMLLALSGEFDLNSNSNKGTTLGSNEIACKKFNNNETVVDNINIRSNQRSNFINLNFFILNLQITCKTTFVEIPDLDKRKDISNTSQDY